MNSLIELKTKEEIDFVIKNVEDKVVVLRFGKKEDPATMKQDNILDKASVELSRMAVAYTVEAEEVPIYTDYFDIYLIPATIFFFNAHHMKVDFRTQDHTKWIGAFEIKQDYIDLIEVIHKGGLYGKFQVESPIPRNRVPKYEIIFNEL